MIGVARSGQKNIDGAMTEAAVLLLAVRFASSSARSKHVSWSIVLPCQIDRFSQRTPRFV